MTRCLGHLKFPAVYFFKKNFKSHFTGLKYSYMFDFCEYCNF